MNLKELQKFDDIGLARYQSSYQPDTANYLLCQIEWQRRLHDYGYGLAERVSSRERIASFFGVLVGCITTLLGVWLAK